MCLRHYVAFRHPYKHFLTIGPFWFPPYCERLVSGLPDLLTVLFKQEATGDLC